MSQQTIRRDWDDLGILQRGRAKSRAYFIPYSDWSGALTYNREAPLVQILEWHMEVQLCKRAKVGSGLFLRGGV